MKISRKEIYKMTENNKNDSENIHDHMKNLEKFSMKRILMEDTDKKLVFVEATVKDSTAPAVLIMEKLPWTSEDVTGALCEATAARQEFSNDIYGQYSLSLQAENNRVKCNVIHPATQKHLEKYLSSPSHLVLETPELYRSITLPHINAEQFSLQWVYNVLEHKKEVERIIYEDPDPETGFILAPDFKWNGESCSDLYCLAIVHQRGLKSLRDLRGRHLPLLVNIKEKCVGAVSERYGLEPSQVRCYLHYQPSYYHLHVHVTNIAFSPPGFGCEKSHLLDSVIDNIQRDSNYYQAAALSFVVREKDKLFKKYQDSGYFPLSPDKSRHNCIEAEFESGSSVKTLQFLQQLGRAKHEPCGEFWETTYGETAWRMAVIVLCLPPGLDLNRLVGLALCSSLTSLGGANDENTEWSVKVSDVTRELKELLPAATAGHLAEMFAEHAMVRQGKLDGSKEHRAYRGVLELEEVLLRWEEEVKEGKPEGEVGSLLKKMCQVKLPGWEQFVHLSDPAPLAALLQFLLSVSRLQRLRRTGWLRCGVREPETVAGHMFRMGMMGLMVGGVEAAIISICHDMAETVIGDITPHCNVSNEDKAAREDEAFRALVKDLPGHIVHLIYGSFRRYEDQKPGDVEAKLVKDLDKFDMILQALEYEKRDKKGKYLQQFFDSTATVFQTESGIKWQKELLLIREKYFEDS